MVRINYRRFKKKTLQYPMIFNKSKIHRSEDLPPWYAALETKRDISDSHTKTVFHLRFLQLVADSTNNLHSRLFCIAKGEISTTRKWRYPFYSAS